MPVSTISKPACFDVGSTAHVILVTPSKIFSASIGDSRGVVSKNKTASQISQDHKPDNDYEKNRIIRKIVYSLI